jgi:photosystem II stability/assembly factor-like uncharacterized protein
MNGSRPEGRCKRAWRRLAVASLGAVILAGCATGGLKPDSPLPAQQGLLVVRIASNADEPERWDTLEVWSIDQKKLTFLSPVAPAMSTSIFVDALPPGQYRLDALKSVKRLGNLILTRTAPLHERLGTFRIEAGQVTNLGTVVIQPELNSASSQQYAVTLTTVPAELETLLQRRLPVIAAAALGKPVLGWDAVPNEGAQQAVLRLAQAGSAHVNDPREAPWGEVVAGSLLGQVLVRSTDGKWRSLATGYTGEIVAVVPLRSGELLAAGEDGLLLLSADRGRSWSRLPVPTSGLLEDVDQADDGRVYLLAREESGHALYVAADPKGNGWEKLRSMMRFPSVPRSAGTPGGEPALLVGRGVAIAAPPQHFVSHDAATGEWHTALTIRFTLKEPRAFTRLRARADGLLYGPAKSNWSSAKGSLFGGEGIVASRDGGKSWETLSTWDESSSVKDVLFTSATTGYALVRRKGVEGLLVMATADGGKSWAEHGKVPSFAGTVFPAEGGRVLLAASERGAVWASRDQGKSWSLERAVMFR